MPRDEVESAYFTLLRAREELAELQRYDEYLRAEAQRLRRTTSEGAALAAEVPNRQRRPLRHTDEPLQQAIERRLAVIAEELDRLPERTVAAEQHVRECESEYELLRRGR